MSSLAEFFHMGGYAAYVWSAYLVAAVVLLLNVILSARAQRQAIAELRAYRRLQQPASAPATASAAAVDSGGAST